MLPADSECSSSPRSAGDAPTPSQTAFKVFDVQPRQPLQLAEELRVSLIAEEFISFTVPRPQGHQTLLVVLICFV